MPVQKTQYITAVFTGTPEMDSTVEGAARVYPGSTIKFTGTIKNGAKKTAIKSIGVNALDFPYILGEGTNGRELAYQNITIAAGKTGTFTIEFTLPEDITDGFDAYETTLYPDIKALEFKPYIVVYDAVGGYNGKWAAMDWPDLDDLDDFYILKKYPLDIKYNTVSINRASNIDDKYQLANEGIYGLCDMFKISLNEEASQDDITVSHIIISNNDAEEEQIDINIQIPTIQQALSDEGYSETAPILLDHIKFSVNNSYTLKFYIGDEYDVYQNTVYIERAFANMHLAGAANGGVSFGGFSSSTDDEPKLESYYKGYFYKGFDEITVKMLSNIMYPIGAIFMCAEYDQNPTKDNLPTLLFGGIWIQVSGFLAGEGAVGTDIFFEYGTTGGSATHQHLAPIGYSGSVFGAVDFGNNGNGTSTETAHGYKTIAATTDSSGSYNGITKIYTGEGSSIPPYTVVGIWQRTELYDPNKEDDEYVE